MKELVFSYRAPTGNIDFDGIPLREVRTLSIAVESTSVGINSISITDEALKNFVSIFNNPAYQIESVKFRERKDV